MKSPERKYFFQISGIAFSVLLLLSSCENDSKVEADSTYLPDIVVPLNNGTFTPTTEFTVEPTTAPPDTFTPTSTVIELGTATFTPSPTNTLEPTTVAVETLTPTPTTTENPTATVTPTPSETPVIDNPGFEIKSVSSMNQSKDRVCNQRSAEWINQWVTEMAKLGITHVGLETPYDNPLCSGLSDTYSIDYTQRWLDSIRSHQSVEGKPLSVLHRHMFLSFEGIYDTLKNPNLDYSTMIGEYIRNNPTFFQAGDVFTIMPEPQNGGVVGATGCAQGICIFPSVEEFNTFLVNATNEAKSAFKDIGLEDQITFSCCGFDGYIAWGDNNPDHLGKSFLYEETVEQIGLFTIDHYPQGGATMAEDLEEFRRLWGDIPLVIGEWGPINSTEETVEQEVIDTMEAFENDGNIVGVQYWQGGPSGPESLVHSDFEHNSQFDELQDAFTK